MSVILATAGYDHTIRFWEAPSGLCSRTLRYPDSQVNCLEITPDKQFLAAGGNPQVRLYDINNTTMENPVLTLEGHTSSVTSLGFQRDGRYLYSGSEDGMCCCDYEVVTFMSKLTLHSIQHSQRYCKTVGFTITNLFSAISKSNRCDGALDIEATRISS